MQCSQCSSERVAGVTAKCDDRCVVAIGDNNPRSDYVPRGMNIGGGDYLNVVFCLNCGHMAGRWPVAETELEDADEQR